MSNIDISLISYNIHKGFNLTGSKFTLASMRAALADVNPDLLLLQEVQGQHQFHKFKNTPYPQEPDYIYLAKNGWEYYVYGKNATYDYAHHGNAILSKFPITFWQNINVATNKSASRSILHSKIALPNCQEALHIICIHLGLFEKERVRQLCSLIELVNAHFLPHEPVIIAGDFNDWRKHLDLHLCQQLNMQEVFTFLYGNLARTFPAHQPLLKTDRIYFRNITLTDAKIFKKTPWNRLSDHVPLYAKFNLTTASNAQ